MGKVAVTGAGGFIGSALVKRLRLDNREVVCIDNGFRHGGFGYDVRNLRYETLRDCDTVIHAAWINGTKNFYEIPWEVIDVGIRGTLNLLHACKEVGIKNFHFISSSEVHVGTRIFPTLEAVEVGIPDIRNPRFSYGGSKLAAELMVLNCPWLEHVTITRPNNVYGPNMGRDHVIPQLIDKVRDRHIVEVQGGDQTRTFCYISDFVDGFMHIFEQGQHREIYNVGGDMETSINEVAGRIAVILNREIEILSVPVPPGDPKRRYPSIAKLRALGYTPAVSLQDGLLACI